MLCQISCRSAQNCAWA